MLQKLPALHQLSKKVKNKRNVILLMLCSSFYFIAGTLLFVQFQAQKGNKKDCITYNIAIISP